MLQTARSARPLQVLAGLVLGGSLLLSSTVAVAQEAEPPPPPPVSPEWPLVARLQRAIVVRALSNWHHRFDQSAKKLEAELEKDADRFARMVMQDGAGPAVERARAAYDAAVKAHAPTMRRRADAYHRAAMKQNPVLRFIAMRRLASAINAEAKAKQKRIKAYDAYQRALQRAPGFVNLVTSSETLKVELERARQERQDAAAALHRLDHEQLPPVQRAVQGAARARQAAGSTAEPDAERELRELNAVRTQLEAGIARMDANIRHMEQEARGLHSDLVLRRSGTLRENWSPSKGANALIKSGDVVVRDRKELRAARLWANRLAAVIQRMLLTPEQEAELRAAEQAEQRARKRLFAVAGNGKDVSGETGGELYLAVQALDRATRKAEKAQGDLTSDPGILAAQQRVRNAYAEMIQARQDAADAPERLRQVRARLVPAKLPEIELHAEVERERRGSLFTRGDRQDIGWAGRTLDSMEALVRAQVRQSMGAPPAKEGVLASAVRAVGAAVAGAVGLAAADQAEGGQGEGAQARPARPARPGPTSGRLARLAGLGLDVPARLGEEPQTQTLTVGADLDATPLSPLIPPPAEAPQPIPAATQPPAPPRTPAPAQPPAPVQPQPPAPVIPPAQVAPMTPSASGGADVPMDPIYQALRARLVRFAFERVRTGDSEAEVLAAVKAEIERMHGTAASLPGELGTVTSYLLDPANQVAEAIVRETHGGPGDDDADAPLAPGPTPPGTPPNRQGNDQANGPDTGQGTTGSGGPATRRGTEPPTARRPDPPRAGLGADSGTQVLPPVAAPGTVRGEGSVTLEDLLAGLSNGRIIRPGDIIVRPPGDPADGQRPPGQAGDGTEGDEQVVPGAQEGDEDEEDHAPDSGGRVKGGTLPAPCERMVEGECLDPVVPDRGPDVKIPAIDLAAEAAKQPAPCIKEGPSCRPADRDIGDDLKLAPIDLSGKQHPDPCSVAMSGCHDFGEIFGRPTISEPQPGDVDDEDNGADPVGRDPRAPGQSTGTIEFLWDGLPASVSVPAAAASVQPVPSPDADVLEQMFGPELPARPDNGQSGGSLGGGSFVQRMLPNGLVTTAPSLATAPEQPSGAYDKLFDPSAAPGADCEVNC